MSWSEHLVAIIPARAGSERLAGKNLKEVGGLSLVERAVHHASAAGAARIIVSTDDPRVVAAVRGQDRVRILDRPVHLASPQATTDDVIRHAVEHAPIEAGSLVLLLQPTSPFRNRLLLAACIESASANPESVSLSVVPASKKPSWLKCLAPGGLLVEPDVSCQPVVPSGAVYAFQRDSFTEAGGFESMSKIGVLADPVHACDIDEGFEYVIAVALAQAGFGDDVLDR